MEPLAPHHVADFVSRPIRPADVEEWVDGCGQHPRDALPEMVDWTEFGRALVLDTGECVLLWGCRVDGDVGTIWLIASAFDLSLAPLIHREFGHVAWPEVTALAPILQAYPSSKNTVHHRWLEHFGFKKVLTVTFRPGGVPFYRYVRRRHDVL